MNAVKPVAIAAGLLALIFLPLLNDPYLDRLATLGAIFGILALGLNLTAGRLGLFDFGYIVYFGLGGYTTALLTLRSDWPYFAALLASISIASVAAVAIGLVVLRLRGAYFVIATFSFLTVVYYVSINWKQLTNGPLGLIGVPAAKLSLPGLGSLEFLNTTPALELAVAALALSTLVIWRLLGTTVGRAWDAIRENEDLAASVGIDATRYALGGLIVSAALGGFGGSLYAQYLGIVTPEIFAFGHMVDVLLMVVIGGTGTLFGPLVGAFLVISVPEFLRVAEELRLPIYGLLLVIIILFAPRGLASLQPLRLVRRARAANIAPARRPAIEREEASAEG